MKKGVLPEDNSKSLTRQTLAGPTSTSFFFCSGLGVSGGDPFKDTMAARLSHALPRFAWNTLNHRPLHELLSHKHHWLRWTQPDKGLFIVIAEDNGGRFPQQCHARDDNWVLLIL